MIKLKPCDFPGCTYKKAGNVLAGYTVCAHHLRVLTGEWGTRLRKIIDAVGAVTDAERPRPATEVKSCARDS